jgi:tetratricopeptide (TPR) repeat protein
MRLFLLISLLPTLLLAQGPNAEFRKALDLKDKKQWEESLRIFQQLLKSDSSNNAYLTNTAYLLCKAGNRQTGEEKRQPYFRKAEYLSKKAIALKADDAQGHYNYALALGRINENASSKQKIANAKIIRTECDLALRYDPKLAGAWHILGRWHRTVAGFNFVEKAMINTLFGGVPEGGSYESAIECFSKAVQLEPEAMVHKIELAQTYADRNEGKDAVLARVWCKRVQEMQAQDEDDRDYQRRAATLLQKLD